jgi:hypothetical protein
MKDFSDIKNWNDKPVKFFKFFSNKKLDDNQSHIVTKLEFDVLKVYELIISKFSYLLNCDYRSEPQINLY